LLPAKATARCTAAMCYRRCFAEKGSAGRRFSKKIKNLAGKKTPFRLAVTAPQKQNNFINAG